MDGVAIAAFYLAHIACAAPATRLTFTGVWMLASLLVVLIGLTRIRRARLDSFRRRSPP